MGSLGSLMSMMPGIPKELKDANIDDDDLKPVEAIIRSMTMEERTFPKVINGSRRVRIAAGSGHPARSRAGGRWCGRTGR
jgi:signal recognition particle subunit SRP54